jgi:hypothetical protein
VYFFPINVCSLILHELADEINSKKKERERERRLSGDRGDVQKRTRVVNCNSATNSPECFAATQKELISKINQQSFRSASWLTLLRHAQRQMQTQPYTEAGTEIVSMCTRNMANVMKN